MSMQRACKVADVFVREWAAEAMERIKQTDIAAELRACAPIVDRDTAKAGRTVARKARNAAAYVVAVVRNGKMAMPRLSRVEVTDAELDAIAFYLAKGD